MLTGCWVESINPLYEEGPSKDPDLVFDKSLTGSWSATDDKCTTVLTIMSEDEVYDLQSTEQGEGCGDEGKSYYKARLVKLDDYLFLDLEPRPDDVCDLCLAVHSIVLVKFDNDALCLTPIDSDWLRRAIATKTVALSTLPGHPGKLTASSKELKAFCRKFAGDKATFKPDSTSRFKRKQAT